MEKKEQIILKAIHLLVTNGEHSTPMSLIAKEANTGMGTIYNYFPSKEDLINECYSYLRQKQQLFIQLESNDAGAKFLIQSYCRSAIAYMLSNPTEYLFLKQFYFSPILREDVRRKDQEFFSPIIKVVEQGQKEGYIKNIPTVELFYFVLGGVRSFISYALLTNMPVSDDMIERQVALVWDTLKG